MAADTRVGEWAGALFAAIDSQGAGCFAEFLTRNGEFVFGSAPPVKDRAAVGAFFDAIASLQQTIHRFWDVGDQRIVEGRAHYTRHRDGRDVEVPCADIFELDGERISNYRIYADIYPLHAD